MKIVGAFFMAMFEPGLLHLLSDTGIAMVNWKGRIYSPHHGTSCSPQILTLHHDTGEKTQKPMANVAFP